MSTSSLWFAAVAAAASIGTAIAANGAGGAPPAWRATGVASAAYLQNTPAAAWVSSSGGSSRNHMPTSAMPFTATGTKCSVDDTDPGLPPTCSTSNATQRCSAHCDSAQACSAFFSGSAANGIAACSTNGGTNRQCSVLQPVIAPQGPSQCSAFGGVPGSEFQCSIMNAGGNQACSAENPGVFPGTQCSTFSSTGAVGITRCSVLRGGALQRNYCSVGGVLTPISTPKQCSTFSPGSDCSVLPGSRGFCTAFAPIPAGSCSTFAAPSKCSVIGVASGNFCRWP